MRRPIWREHRPWQNPIRSAEHADLVLAPHPGSLGGRVAGKIKLPENAEQATHGVVRLRCLSHTESVPDEDYDSHSQTHVLWESEQSVVIECANGRETCVFAFDPIPAELPESELPLSGNFVEWQLDIVAIYGAAETRHAFSIPVFWSESDRQPSATRARDVHTLVSKWRSEETWLPYNAEVEAKADTLSVRLHPWRKGDLKRLVLSAVLFLLSLVLLVGAAGMGDVVGISVTGIFGITSLAGAIGGAYISFRVVELRVQPGQLSRQYSIFGRKVGTTNFYASEISHFGTHNGRLHMVLTEFGSISLIEGIEDRELLKELRRLFSSTLESA